MTVKSTILFFMYHFWMLKLNVKNYSTCIFISRDLVLNSKKEKKIPSICNK